MCSCYCRPQRPAGSCCHDGNTVAWQTGQGGEPRCSHEQQDMHCMASHSHPVSRRQETSPQAHGPMYPASKWHGPRASHSEVTTSRDGRSRAIRSCECVPAGRDGPSWVPARLRSAHSPVGNTAVLPLGGLLPGLPLTLATAVLALPLRPDQIPSPRARETLVFMG